MKIQKKTMAVVISTALFLFMTSELRATPINPQDQDESQSAVVAPASPADSRTSPVQTNSPEKAAGGKKPAASRKRLGQLARRRPRRKAVRSSIPAIAARRLRLLKSIYPKEAHRKLVITSGNRNEYQQARAMRHNLNAYGVRYVISLYGGSATVRQIVRAYKANRGNQQKAQKAMTRIITAQVAKGIYISDHLRGRAVDIRSRGRNGAHLAVLQRIAHEIGGSAFAEKDHIHYRLV